MIHEAQKYSQVLRGASLLWGAFAHLPAVSQGGMEHSSSGYGAGAAQGGVGGVVARC